MLRDDDWNMARQQGAVSGKILSSENGSPRKALSFPSCLRTLVDLTFFKKAAQSRGWMYMYLCFKM